MRRKSTAQHYDKGMHSTQLEDPEIHKILKCY